MELLTLLTDLGTGSNPAKGIVDVLQDKSRLLFNPGLLSLLPHLPLLLHLHLPWIRVFLTSGLMLCPPIQLETFLSAIGLCQTFAAPGDDKLEKAKWLFKERGFPYPYLIQLDLI